MCHGVVTGELHGSCRRSPLCRRTGGWYLIQLFFCDAILTIHLHGHQMLSVPQTSAASLKHSPSICPHFLTLRELSEAYDWLEKYKASLKEAELHQVRTTIRWTI